MTDDKPEYQRPLCAPLSDDELEAVTGGNVLYGGVAAQCTNGANIANFVSRLAGAMGDGWQD